MTADPNRYAVGSASRVIRLLAALGSSPARSWTTSELREATGSPVASVRRHLATLVKLKYAHRTPDGRYSLGSEVWLLQNEPDYLDLLIGAAADPLADLRDATGETTLLTVLSGHDAVCLTKAEARSALVARPPLSDRLPAHTSAQGLANLAVINPRDSTRFHPGISSRSDASPTDAAIFQAELAETRRRGYAVDRDTIEVGVTGIAVAVPNVIRLAAVGILAPSRRLARSDEPVVARTLAETATVIATRLAQGRAARLREFNGRARP